MKHFALAAAAVAALLAAGAASAQPVRGGFADGHAAAFHTAPGGFRAGRADFHPGPVGFHPRPGVGGPHGVWSVGFRHWGYGQFVPRDLLVPAAFLVDYAAYDLAAPPIDCEWVQDGPDALLINLDTGMVIQVVPGAFA